MRKYVGVDVHADSCTICSVGSTGKRVRRDVVETNGEALVEYFQQMPGEVHLCLEECEWSSWLWEILSPHVSEIVVVRAWSGARMGRRTTRSMRMAWRSDFGWGR